jgi:hypothetical protein
MREHRVPQSLDVNGAAVQVDVAAVGRAEKLFLVRARPPEQAVTQQGSRGVAAIHGRRHPVEAHWGSED